jgi:hypothetical protein
MPPGQVVDAIVALWNQIHAGPAAAVYVPPLNTFPNTIGGIIAASSGKAGATVVAPLTGNVDPNAFYAFQLVAPIQAMAAMKPPQAYQLPYPTSVVANAFSGILTPPSTARQVMVNQGALITQNTLASVATSAVVVAAVGAAATTGYALWTGQSVARVFAGLLE